LLLTAVKLFDASELQGAKVAQLI